MASDSGRAELKALENLEIREALRGCLRVGRYKWVSSIQAVEKHARSFVKFAQQKGIGRFLPVPPAPSHADARPRNRQ